MSTYRFSNCPYCKKTLEFMERSESYYFDRYIGLKYERCPHCNKIYTTNKKFYYQMTEDEKKDLHLAYIGNIFFNSLGYIALVFIVLIIIFSIIYSDVTEQMGLFGTIIAISSFFCFVLGYHFSKQDYEEAKQLSTKDYDYLQKDLELLNLNNSVETK